MASPRSGSNLLEEKIFRMISKLSINDEKVLALGELLHWEHFENAGVDGNKAEFHSDIRQQHRSEVLKIIETSNRPITMRIFPQDWHKKFINLDDFFTKLQENNFRFVYLHRNIKDRVISLSVAQKTETWHKRVNDNEIKFIGGSNRLDISKDNKISIDLETIAENYLKTRTTDFYLRQYIKKFKGDIIHYETFQEDCDRIGIISDQCSHRKLYCEDYSDLISNYAEISDLIDWF
jgi:hypothetical protein